MNAAADYARVVSALDTSRLPAYVSFVQSDSAKGLGHETDAPQTIYVRTKDGAIVAGLPDSTPQPSDHTGHVRDSNPVSKPAFNPNCYAPTAEETASYSGRPALRITLRPTCTSSDEDALFTTLYADPETLLPIEADGTLNEDHMRVTLVESFAQFGALTFPASIDVNVHGTGFLFWVREHVRVDYTDYRLYRSNPIPKRQSTKP